MFFAGIPCKIGGFLKASKTGSWFCLSDGKNGGVKNRSCFHGLACSAGHSA
jgi:hypothetical protein